MHNFYNERRMTIGVELEPEWAEMHARTITGSCLELEALGFVSASFDAIITSPVYGNRMSDHHDARDGSKRNTYKHALGRDLSDGSSAVLQWGPSKAARERYKDFHREAWRGVLDVLKPDGLFVLNISDHIRGGERMRVSAWHKAVLATYGVDWYREDRIETPRNGQGQNGELRVEYESIFYGHKR